MPLSAFQEVEARLDDCPYSEADRLSTSWPPIYSEVRDRIDRITGVIRPKRSYKKPKGWKREKLLRSHYRKISVDILNQITGYELSFFIDSPGRLDHRLQWLLENILISGKRSRSCRFYIAIAQDAGVWPIPKWWLVTRRLKGTNRTFSNSASLK